MRVSFGEPPFSPLLPSPSEHHLGGAAGPCSVTARVDKLALSTSGRVLPERLPVDGGGRMTQRHPGICRRKSSPVERTQADPSVTAEKPQAQALLSCCPALGHRPSCRHYRGRALTSQRPLVWPLQASSVLKSPQGPVPALRAPCFPPPPDSPICSVRPEPLRVLPARPAPAGSVPLAQLPLADAFGLAFHAAERPCLLRIRGPCAHPPPTSSAFVCRLLARRPR